MAGRYVYVIGVSSNPVKIGIAENVTRRRSELQIGCPDELIVHHIHMAPYFDAEQIEASCHATFADRRRRGEWFDVDAEEAIQTIKRASEAVREMRRVTPAPFIYHDVERLIARRDLDHQALAAIADYRVCLDRPDSKYEIARRDRAMLLRAGPEAAAVFQLVAVERKSLIEALRRSPVALRKAEDALRRALVVLTSDYEKRRMTLGGLDFPRKTAA